MYKIDDLDTVGMNEPLLAIKSAVAINEIETTLELDPNQRKATLERWKQILTNKVKLMSNLQLIELQI